MSTRTRFEKEARDNSEMAYCSAAFPFVKDHLATKNHPQYITDLCVISFFSSSFVAWLVCTFPGIQIFVRC